MDAQFAMSAQTFRSKLLTQGVNVEHTRVTHSAWHDVPLPDIVERLAYTVRYAPMFLKMTLVAVLFVLVGWAVGVTTSELEVVPQHASVSVFVGVVVVGAIAVSLAAHVVMYRVRAKEAYRIRELEDKVIEYQDKFSKMLGSSAEEAAAMAAEAMGIKVDKPAGAEETLEDIAAKMGVSTQTLNAMDALQKAMETGNIVALSKDIKRLEKASGFQAPRAASTRGPPPPGSSGPSLVSAWDEGADDAGGTSAALRKLPRLQLWAAATLHRRLQAVAMAVSRGAPVRDVLHGDNAAAKTVATVPVESFLTGEEAAGAGAGVSGILLADARRTVVEGLDGEGPAARWLARVAEDAPKAEICDAVLDACEALNAEVTLSNHALWLAVDAAARAVERSEADTLTKARHEANKTLGNMRLELKDAWAAVAAARIRQAALQETLAGEVAKARRLADRLARGDGEPGDAELDELDAADEEIATLKRTLKLTRKELEKTRRDALEAKEAASVAAAREDAERAAASKFKQSAIISQRLLAEFRSAVAVSEAAAHAGSASGGDGVLATEAVTSPATVEPPMNEGDDDEEPDLGATRAEVEAWLAKQDAKRAAFENPNATLAEKFGEGEVDASLEPEQTARRAALRRDDPLLAAWADANAAIDELGGGRDAVDALVAQVLLSPAAPLEFLSKANAALRAKCDADRDDAHLALYGGFLDAQETLKARAAFVPVSAAAARQLAHPAQMLTLRDLVPELQFRVDAVTACTAYEEIVRHIRTLGLDDVDYGGERALKKQKQPTASASKASDGEGNQGGAGGTNTSEAVGGPMPAGMRGERAAVLRRVCAAGLADGIAGVVRRLDDERHRYSRRVARARLERQSLLNTWRESCDVVGVDAAVSEAGLVAECGAGVRAATLEALRQRVAHMQGWARITSGRRAVKELRAQAALARAKYASDKTSRRQAIASYKAKQRALAGGVKGLQTVIGKPPSGASLVSYERLRFTALSAEEVRETVEMLIVPASAWGDAAFASADADGSGEVDRDELRAALVALGMDKVSDEEVDEIFDAVDVDRSGLVDRDEFKEVAIVLSEREERRNAEAMADGVDADGDGGIDRSEMWDGLEALGLELSESQVDMLWDKCDADGSGELDVAEFGKAVKMARLALDHVGEGERFYAEADVRERLSSGAAKYQGLNPTMVGDVVATFKAMISAAKAAAAELDDEHEDALHREPASISAVELDQIVSDVLGAQADN